jgi:hypothetical protein
MSDVHKDGYITFNVNGKERHVRIVGTYEAPWFCGLDICAILEYKNQKKALQEHVLFYQKKSLSVLSSEMDFTSTNLIGANNLENLSYHKGKAVYINGFGFKTLIKKSHMINPSNAKAIAEHPFIKQFVNYEVITMRKEQEYISAIKETFHYLTCYTQFSIDQYRREDYIKKKIGCDFVRFNPDEPGFNIFTVIGDITLDYMYTRDIQNINLLEYELQNMKL